MLAENKATLQLNKVNERLIEKNIIFDGVIISSNRGVPYLWLSRNELNISICYFGRTKCFKIWTGCGTPDNKKIATVKLWMDVSKEIEKLVN